MIVSPATNAVLSDKASTSASAKIGNGNFSTVLNSAVSAQKSTNLDAIFQEASEKYGVPVNLLKAVAKAESNFNASAKSSCGAMGIMQLMPATAKSLGVANPYDAEQNIMGGAKFLGQLLKRFDGNTKLAVAAYNAGPGSVIKYSGVPPYKETQNYVVKVMGYMGKQINAGTLNEKSYVQSAPVQHDNTSQEIASTDTSSENDGLSSKEYAQLLNIYQYQLQISMLSDFDSDNDMFGGSKIFE